MLFPVNYQIYLPEIINKKGEFYSFSALNINNNHIQNCIYVIFKNDEIEFKLSCDYKYTNYTENAKIFSIENYLIFSNLYNINLYINKPEIFLFINKHWFFFIQNFI